MKKHFQNKIRRNLSLCLLLFVILFGGGIALIPSANAAITTVTVTDPDGGEVWADSHNITWTTDDPGSGTVNIYYCIGTNCSENNYTQIVAGEANDGSYPWDTTTAGGDATTYKIKVANAADTLIADSSNATFTIDNTHPTVTDGNISISGATGTGGAYKVGNTVTATWNNTAGGDNNSDIAGVTVNFSAFGGGAAVVASNSSGTWTATYTILGSEAIDGTNKNVIVTATDNAGNTTGTSDTTNATLDATAPTINVAGTIALTNDVNSDSAASIGDTITYAGGTPGAADGDSWTVNLSAYGLSAAAVPGAYVVIAGDDDAALSATETITDNAGNTATGSVTITGAFDIDNIAPIITVPGTITLSNDLSSDGVASIGDTITYAAGTLSVADGDSWKVNLSAYGLSATAAPGAYVVVADNDDAAFSATETVLDNAKNNDTGSVTLVGFTNIDDIAPTIGVAGTITLSGDLNLDGVAGIGDTITYAGGTPGAADGDSWTVNLSAYGLGVVSPGAHIIIAGDDEGAFSANETITDNGGNAATGAVTLSGFANIDNKIPTFTVVGTSVDKLGDTIALTFSEAMDPSTLTSLVGITSITDSVLGLPLTLGNDTGAWSAGNTVYTVTLSENTLDRAFIRDGATVTVVLAATVKDVAGNSVSTTGIVSAAVADEDTQPVIVVTAASNHAAGDTITITSSDEVLANTAVTIGNWTVQYDDNGSGLNIQTVTLANASIAWDDDTHTAVTITLDEVTDGAYIPSSKYVKVTPNATNIKDLVGNNGVVADYTATGVTSEATVPAISTTSVADGATGVAVNSTITITLTEALNPATVNSNTVKLYTDVGNNNAVNIGTDIEVPVTISLENNGASTKIYITPNSNLSNSGNYIYRISTGVKDLAGNALASNNDYDFTTVAQSNGSLAVTSISTTRSYATADDTWGNGWAWTFNITVPTTETSFQMKFSNWASGSNSIAAANNIRFYSAQASANADASNARLITVAGTNSTAITLDGDLDANTAGRQIQVTVEAKVPVGSSGGSYSTSYGVTSN